jgi:hypothetical protein
LIELAGQFVTVAGQSVTVMTEVVYTVDVVSFCGLLVCTAAGVVVAETGQTVV